MVFRITPTLGPDIAEVYDRLWFLPPKTNDNDDAVVSYPLGTKVIGSDGGEYFLVKASADIASTATTGTQLAITFAGWTAATGSGGFYSPPGVAITSGQFFHARRGAYNATPA